MKTIIVDDEQLSLHRFTKLVEDIDCVDVVGTFSNPKEALHTILKEEPDILFLDIEMPELSGLDITEVLKKVHPNVQIVFVTAYHNYAVEAFNLNVVDYLMKPVQKHRLEKTIERLKKREHQISPISERFPLVCCFNSLQFRWSDENDFLKIKWRTKKTRELFAYLLFNKDKKVRKDVLVDMLWPHLEWKQGITLLYSAIYQVRRTLRSIEFDNYIEIKNSENYYLLTINEIKIDIELWEDKVDALSELTNEELPKYEDVIQSYKGDFLQKNEYEWAEIERKRLRTTWLYTVRKTVDFLVQENQMLKSINIYHYVQEIYPLGEESYFSLMKLYDKVNNREAVRSQYEKLNNILMQELGVKPNTEIQDWFEEWKQIYA